MPKITVDATSYAASGSYGTINIAGSTMTYGSTKGGGPYYSFIQAGARVPIGAPVANGQYVPVMMTAVYHTMDNAGNVYGMFGLTGRGGLTLKADVFQNSCQPPEYIGDNIVFTSCVYAYHNVYGGIGTPVNCFYAITYLSFIRYSCPQCPYRKTGNVKFGGTWIPLLITGASPYRTQAGFLSNVNVYLINDRPDTVPYIGRPQYAIGWNPNPPFMNGVTYGASVTYFNIGVDIVIGAPQPLDQTVRFRLRGVWKSIDDVGNLISLDGPIDHGGLSMMRDQNYGCLYSVTLSGARVRVACLFVFNNVYGGLGTP